MKPFLPSLAALAALAILAGCSSSSSSDDSVGPASDDDITQAKVFTCTSTDSDAFDNLTVSGSGANEKISVTNDQATKFSAKLDATYNPTAGNEDFKRFQWSGDDPWQDSGGSWMLVDKDLLAGKAGEARFQVRGETFETNSMKCSPKKK